MLHSDSAHCQLGSFRTWIFSVDRSRHPMVGNKGRQGTSANNYCFEQISREANQRVLCYLCRLLGYSRLMFTTGCLGFPAGSLNIAAHSFIPLAGWHKRYSAPPIRNPTDRSPRKDKAIKP